MSNLKETVFKERSPMGKIWFVIRWPFLFIALILLSVWIGMRIAIKTILDVIFGN